jgi:hypothetical protein
MAATYFSTFAFSFSLRKAGFGHLYRLTTSMPWIACLIDRDICKPLRANFVPHKSMEQTLHGLLLTIVVGRNQLAVAEASFAEPSFSSWYSISVFTAQIFSLSTRPDRMLSTAVIAVNIE